MPTEAKEIFEAASKNVRELLTEKGLGLYIPPYQRPFGWDKEKVDKLAEDTLDGYRALARSDESFTFLGTIITIHDINNVTVQPIVRTEVPSRVLTVIDGQQRLSTLLLFCVALHNYIKLAQKAFFGRRDPREYSPCEKWIDGQARRILDDLEPTFFEPQARGADGLTPLYPRMIRAFCDQWARSADLAIYDSPIANLINVYSKTVGDNSVKKYRPVKRENFEGEADLVDRYNQITKILDDYKTDRIIDADPMPSLHEIVESKGLQRALVYHEFEDSVVEYLESSPSDQFAELLRLILIAGYILNRVALTVVRCKNEDFALTVFESLNTTGEPLTAFETFQPRVVSAEGLKEYEKSQAKKFLSDISSYLSNFKAGGQLQNATRDLLISFALTETGLKLSKRLADQRRYLKEEYEQYEKDKEARLAFVRNFRDTTLFIQYAWNSKSPTLEGFPTESNTDVIKLCLSFLYDLDHTIVIPPLIRFYSFALGNSEEGRKQRAPEFEAAIKAITAFSVLWRASRRGTAGIDREYRNIMAGISSLSGLAPLARSKDRHLRNQLEPGEPAAANLKAELHARLFSEGRGRIKDRESWINDAMIIPAYKNSREVTRLVLLAAYHDADLDPDAPGLIRQGKEALAPCLTYGGWRDDRHLSLEHVAPATETTGWTPEIYKNNDIVQSIGNLVLAPIIENSSLSNRCWDEKRVMYRALGASSRDEAERILKEAKDHGITFNADTEWIVENSKHVRHLFALGTLGANWDTTFIEKRSRRILELAWNRLYPWLQ